MKTKILDYRKEERVRNVVRDLDGQPIEYQGYSHHESDTDYAKTVDNRTVYVTFEDEDYDKYGIPHTFKQRYGKGKHDGTFFVQKATLSFSRSYDKGEGSSSRFGSTGTITFSGYIMKKDGTPGVSQQQASFPTHHDEDDPTKPYTLERFNAGQIGWSNRYPNNPDMVRHFDTIEEMEAAIEAESPGGRYHTNRAELNGIKAGKFEKKSVNDPLPDFVQKIVDLVHPESSVLPFAHPLEHRFSEFEVGPYAEVSA